MKSFPLLVDGVDSTMTSCSYRKVAGFTLFEVLIVIIILGVLATLAIPYYNDIQREAKIAVVKGQLAAIRGGLELVHAKVLASGMSTGAGGTNPDWPTLEEVQRNELFLETRPQAIRFLKIVRSENLDKTENKALPPCMLPELTVKMAALPSGVAGRSLADVQRTPKRGDESSGWAYYPGNERDKNGRIVSAVFYVNDDRSLTENVDSGDRVPSEW